MQERVCGAPNRWETARAAGNLPTPGREEACDGKSRCAAKSADCHIHTCATAFPSLWQLLCQSGELIMGKQICSPPPQHTHKELLPPSKASVSSITAPRSLELPPGYQAPLRGRSPEGSATAGGCHHGSPPAAPEHLPLLPLLPPSLTNQPMIIHRCHLTGNKHDCRAQIKGGGGSPIQRSQI